MVTPASHDRPVTTQAGGSLAGRAGRPPQDRGSPSWGRTPRAVWTESATRGLHLGTELSKHDSDSSSNLIPTPGFGTYVKLQTWDPTHLGRQTSASDAHPAQPGAPGPKLGAPSPGHPAPARHPWPGSPPRCAAGAGLASAAGAQRRPPPDTTLSRLLHTGFTRQLSSSPGLLQARHWLPTDLRPLRAEKAFPVQRPPPLPLVLLALPSRAVPDTAG